MCRKIMILTMMIYIINVSPARLYGSHSLKAWGYRIGEFKGEFGETTDWEEFSEEMLTYCQQDVKVNVKLFKKMEALNYSEDALQLEHDIHKILLIQEWDGFPFDEKKALEAWSAMRGAMSNAFPEPKTPTFVDCTHYCLTPYLLQPLWWAVCVAATGDATMATVLVPMPGYAEAQLTGGVVRLRCRDVSWMWHPFTIAGAADGAAIVHVFDAGGWTRALCRLAESFRVHR
mgnify:CR=1 FL=1